VRESKGNDNCKCRSRSLRDDSQKVNGNGYAQSNGNSYGKANTGVSPLRSR